MKIVVAIIVYNRTHNVQRWIECWDKCEKRGAKLVVIDNSSSEEIKKLCKGVVYIPRKNVGFDIGAFQDVCCNRLKGFPQYDYLLWCCDDTLPMTKDFIKPFIDTLNEPGVGLSCMKISLSVQPHVRTTGFCIKRELAEQLIFSANPITTKNECYQFEHKGNDILTRQVRRLGLMCKAVSGDKTSPLWDSGYWLRLDRQAEHEKVFGIKVIETDKVVFVCTIFNTYPQIISSLLLQTHKNWQLLLMHDGPSEMRELINSVINNDKRIEFIETAERKGNWGHYLRKAALEEYPIGNYVVITNADNYYVPTFIEYMLKGFKLSHTAVATYCEKMVHSYKAWDVIPCKLERGFLDCGGVMVKSNIAKEVGFNNIEQHSADWLYFHEIAHRYSWRSFIQVKGSLFVHN